MVFDNRIECDNCYDNYIYKKAEVKQVLEFNSYDIIARLGMMYEHMIEYLNLLISSERNRLRIANPTKNPRITVKQTLVCKTILNKFTHWTWPDNGLADLKFPISWRQRLAKSAMQIKIVK